MNAAPFAMQTVRARHGLAGPVLAQRFHSTREVRVAGQTMTYRTIKQIVDPAVEERYWRRNLKKQTWYDPATPAEEALAWCRFGWEAAVSAETRNRAFDRAESVLARRWKKERRVPDWRAVRAAVRSAYDRIQQKRSGVLSGEAAGRKKRRAEPTQAPSGPPTKHRRG